uniref:Uncharacterized protein n=1 Tax=Oncorhynchus tshawytscha TaxID=74940 RepID=A0A8C8BX53_ONCTS
MCGVASQPREWAHSQFLAHSAQGQYAQQLLTDLMENYSKALWPVEDTDKDTDTALNVTVQITLSQIKGMSQRLLTRSQRRLWIRQMWHNAYLRWNKEDYDGLEVIRIPSSLVWRPDLVLYNKYAQTTSLTNNNCWCMNCNLNLSSFVVVVSYFPFHSQECNLTFGSWTYNGNKVDIAMGMDSEDLPDFVENVKWECHGMPATKIVIMYGCCSDPYPDITYTVLLQRHSSFYIFNLLPHFLISFLAPLGFYLPADSGEKVSLALTVLQLMVAERMPSSDYVPLIGKWYVATMTMITASTALTVFIMNIHFCCADAKPVPHWAKVLIINYMPKIILVYEVRERELCPCHLFPLLFLLTLWTGLLPPPHLQPHHQANGKLGGHSGRENQYRHKHSGSQTPGPQRHPNHGISLPGVDSKLVRNVEYIAICFRWQRASCATRQSYFMWIFFIMVFLMSILFIGKAP